MTRNVTSLGEPVDAMKQAVSQARYYDEYWSGTAGWKPTDSLDHELRCWMQSLIRPKEKLLDVGCGDGTRYGTHLVRGGVEVYGVDVSQVAVEQARAQGLKARRADLHTELPFQTNEFDASVCLEVFEHLLDPEFTAAEIYRVLKPGARFLVSVPNAAAWRNRADLLLLGRFNPTGSPQTSRHFPWRDPHIRFFTSRSLSDMLQGVGFVVEKQGGLDTMFLSSAPGFRRILNWTLAKPINQVCAMLGRKFYRLLAGRCVAIVRKPA